MQTDQLTAVDTNEEYIVPVNAAKEPPVLGTVFKAVVIETVKDFFSGILGFFYRYIRHFLTSFRYFWSPTLRKEPFDKMDYKENCQHSFELALLVLFMIIFSVKLEWIPQTSPETLNLLNNDLSQMGIQFMWFLIFAFTYFVLAILCIFSGRMLRSVLKIRVTKRESDILFTYLNNAFFSIAAIVALVVRCITSTELSDMQSISEGLMIIFTPMVILFTLIWAIRFIIVNKISFVKGVLFFLFSVVAYSFLFLSGSLITAIFLISI